MEGVSGGHVTWMGVIRIVHESFVKKSEEKTTWRPRHKWEHNIKINCKEMELVVMDRF
jgi:hypothetical protein